MTRKQALSALLRSWTSVPTLRWPREAPGPQRNSQGAARGKPGGSHRVDPPCRRRQSHRAALALAWNRRDWRRLAEYGVALLCAGLMLFAILYGYLQV